MMAKKLNQHKPGKKHRILFVARSMKRLWHVLLLAAIILWLVWYSAAYFQSYFSPPYDVYLLYAAIVFSICFFFAFLLRNSGYIQARNNDIRLQVPLYNLRIPYAMVQSVRMEPLRELYRGRKPGWSSRKFMKPFLRETVAVLRLKRYPLPAVLLRLVVPNYLFIPRGTGFLVLIKDYIGFNTEVDSRRTVNFNRDPVQEKKHQQNEKYDPFSDPFNG